MSAKDDTDKRARAARKARRKAIKNTPIAEDISVGMKQYPPTAIALRAWMEAKKLSSKDVAEALRLSDGRVVRFWTSSKNPRPIPYPSWYTLRRKFGR